MSTATGCRRGTVFLSACAAVLLAARPGLVRAQWVEFVDETATRLVVDPSLGANDTEEKDYAWDDIDRDGDIDLVVVRKQIGSTPGRRRNVLLMNENGVLVDRTAEYATAADDGGQGFLDLTNDRDVALVDVDGDGWLDMVTTVTYGQGLPKTISHPRVYINLRNDGNGNWLGFRYEEARIPQFPIEANSPTVGFGDLTGDGAPDLYIGDYLNSLEDRLLVNDGNGFFTDETELRTTPWLTDSTFTAHAVIADLNHDGYNDIIKDNALGGYDLRLGYNDPHNPGFFDEFNGDILCGACSPYFVAVGNLNNDGLLDVVEADDGADRYFLNQGNGPDGQANWDVFTFANSSNGFDNNTVIADLDKDGWNDVLIADVDVDLPNCNSRMDIHHNLGGPPNVTFQEDVGNLPTGNPGPLRGTHDVAVFDINGDSWLDLVIGTCNGTTVWINQPPFGIEFSYPEGLPDFLPPNQPHTIEVQLTPIGDDLQPGTPTLHYSATGWPFVEEAMTSLGEDRYEATLPGLDCLQRVDFYFSAQLTGGFEFRDPPSAPTDTYSAISAEGIGIVFSDAMEGDVSAWEIFNDPSLESGEWEQADPNGTIWNSELAAPDEDATPGEGNVMAFVTQNCEGPECLNAGDTDIDGGATYLISPTLNVAGSDATIRYTRWFYTSSSAGEDLLTTQVSNDGGGAWTTVHTTEGTGSSWETVEFLVSDYVTPTANVRVRFVAADLLPGSIAEGGIDDFEVEQLLCGPVECEADLDGDGSVGASDLAILLGGWGPCQDCPADFDDDGVIGAADLAVLLGSWGACP